MSIKRKSQAAPLLPLIGAILSLFLSAPAAELRTLTGHVPAAVANLRPLGPLPATNHLRLALSLPLRNRDALGNLLHRLYDPASPDYHHYLTPAQFTAQFGPTAGQYQSVISYAKASGLETVGTHDSRVLLDVRGTVADVEKAFHVRLRNYEHPTERRQFYAPDTEPSVDAGLPIVEINGLNNYALLRPTARRKGLSSRGITAGGGGSAPGSNFMGKDFTNAYLPGGALNGAGQIVGLFEADGYYASDIAAYETLTGLPNVPLQNVLIDITNAPAGAENYEVALDIELAIAMAPGLSSVVVFEGSNNVADWLDILDRMASSNQIKQFSSSWGYTGGADPNTSFDATFQQMATQGQSFLQASGDGDAWVNPIMVPADSPYVTSVGGTALTMTGSGAAYSSETAWNSGDLGPDDAWGPNGDGYWGSGGGVSGVYSIPYWQTNVSMTANKGSTNMRNIPDVALVADNIWVTYNDGASGSFMGTSCAAPLWAGFIALVNQQAAAAGGQSAGFLNPAIYALGQKAIYTNCLHDIATGSNTWSESPTNYFAVTGYDLCAGWGTPTGTNLVNALAASDSLRVSPASGFTATGGPGGPFTVTSQTYVLTNTGASSLNWTALAAASWLNVSPGSGTLASGGAAETVTVSLNATASNETAGTYSATVWFTNLSDDVGQARAVNLDVIAPPTVTVSPGNQTVATGTNVEFAAAVTGASPLSYQWRQNGTNLSDGALVSGSSTTNLALSDVSAAAAGSYIIVVSNAAGVVTSAPPATLAVVPSQQLVQNGGFETGSFPPWALSGNTSDTFVSTGAYAHSGEYGAQLGPAGSLGYLSQTLATVPGQVYALSVWLDSPNGQTPNEFLVSWNGTVLFDEVDIPQIFWTNLQFTVPAAVTNTVLEFGFRDDPAYLGLDDISVLPMRPVLQNAGWNSGVATFSWIALPGSNYQVQYTTNLSQTNWMALGGAFTATNIVVTITDSTATNGRKFYRAVLTP